MKRRRSVDTSEPPLKQDMNTLSLLQNLHVIYQFLDPDTFGVLCLISKPFYQKLSGSMFKVEYLQTKFGSMRGLYFFQLFISLQAHCWFGLDVFTRYLRVHPTKKEAIYTIKRVMSEKQRMFMMDLESFDRNLRSFDSWKGYETTTTFEDFPAVGLEDNDPRFVFNVFGKKLHVRASNSFKKKFKILKTRKSRLTSKSNDFSRSLIEKILTFIPPSQYQSLILINSNWFNTIIQESFWKKMVIKKYGDLSNAFMFPVFLVIEIYSKKSKGNSVSNIEIFDCEESAKHHLQGLIANQYSKRSSETFPEYNDDWDHIECRFNRSVYTDLGEIYLNNFYKIPNYLKDFLESCYCGISWC